MTPTEAKELIQGIEIGDYAVIPAAGMRASGVVKKLKQACREHGLGVYILEEGGSLTVTRRY